MATASRKATTTINQNLAHYLFLRREAWELTSWDRKTGTL